MAGSVRTALSDPLRVVLTESRVKTYFPNIPYQDVLGKKLIYDDTLQVLISGIIKDFDQPSDFNFKEFISKVTIENKKIRGQWNWDDWGSINSSSQLFVKLNAAVKPALINPQLDQLAKKYKEEDVTQILQPLKDLNFNSDLWGFVLGKHMYRLSLGRNTWFIALFNFINFYLAVFYFIHFSSVYFSIFKVFEFFCSS